MYKDIPTNNKGIRVHITGYTGGDTGCTLRGYAIDDQGVRIDGSKTLRRAAYTAADIPATEMHLVAAVLNKLSIKAESGSHTGSKIGDLDSKHPMVIAYQEMLDEGLKISENWKETVEKRAISLFVRHALPRILKYSTEPFCEADRDKLLQEIAEDVRNHGNSHQNENTVLNTARSNLTTCAIVYSNGLRRIDPMLPNLELTPPRQKKTYTEEQVKSLPRKVRRRFARKLKALIPEKPKLVLGAVIMTDASARTAEAAAVIPSRDTKMVESTLCILICWQEKNGRRCAVLKSSAAYRVVPLSAWGREMIKQCCDHIDAWPDDPDEAPITANALRQFVRSLLRDSGLDDDFWPTAQAAEARNPDKDGKGNPIWDVVAYTLRHDRASIWRNICGLTVEECDYLLGHADQTSKKRKTDYRLDSEQIRLAAKLENYVCDAELSAHPGLVPNPLTHGDDVEIALYEAATWINASDDTLVIDLDILAAVAAEEITIDVDNGDIAYITPRHRNTHGTRENKPLIGNGQLDFIEEEGQNTDGRTEKSMEQSSEQTDV